MTEKRVRAKARHAEVWLLLAVFAAVAVTAMIVLVRADWNDDLRLELAKTALTALSLTVIGSMASLAVWLYQKRREVEFDRVLEIERERRDDERKAKEEIARRESDARREQAERQIQAEENLRRQAERLRDARARDDALLRSLLQDTLRSYNRVKRIRRLLKAYTKGGEQGPFLQLELYDLHLQELIDEQLAFEELKRITRVKGHDRLELPALESHYARIENYLNTVVYEYEQRRHRIASGEILDASAFPKLRGFLKQRDDQSRGLVGFHAVSDEVNEITAQIRTSLMRELHLPDVDVDVPSRLDNPSS